MQCREYPGQHFTMKKDKCEIFTFTYLILDETLYYTPEKSINKLFNKNKEIYVIF